MLYPVITDLDGILEDAADACCGPLPLSFDFRE
jgi:hypothetical protein